MTSQMTLKMSESMCIRATRVEVITFVRRC